MPKFTPDRFPPGFFDLPAGAGEKLAIAVIEQWTTSTQDRSDEATHRARMERQSRTVTFEVSGVTLTARHL